MLSANPIEADPSTPNNLQQPQEPARPSPPTFSPFHVIPGINNFRDIGGWPICSSSGQPIGHVRKGIIYRGSDTNKTTPEGEAKLRELGIVVDFDLRSKQQIANTGGYKDLEGIERRWTPVFEEEQYTEEAARKRYELYAGDGTDGIVEAFTEILTSGTTMFRTVLQHVLSTTLSAPDKSPAGSFMHCTTGNNRTGVFISMLLALLGVPRASICEEYTLSEQGLALTRHINVERLLKKGAFKKYGPDEAKRRCERMVGARTESMEAMLREADRLWGGAEGYFLDEVKLTQQEIEKLKELLTVRDYED